jgi:hypothetical protein
VLGIIWTCTHCNLLDESLLLSYQQLHSTLVFLEVSITTQAFADELMPDLHLQFYTGTFSVLAQCLQCRYCILSLLCMATALQSHLTGSHASTHSSAAYYHIYGMILHCVLFNTQVSTAAGGLTELINGLHYNIMNIEICVCVYDQEIV